VCTLSGNSFDDNLSHERTESDEKGKQHETAYIGSPTQKNKFCDPDYLDYLWEM